MSDAYDQEKGLTEAFPGAVAEVVNPAALAAFADYTPRSETEREFLSGLAVLPWLADGEAAIKLALQIATGDPSKAGEQLEGRSVRNLKLANKVHTIRDLALSRSSFANAENGGCPVFASVEAAFEDGELVTYSIGGWRPIGQLSAWYRGHLLPKKCQIIEIPSSKGNPALAYVDA